MYSLPNPIRLLTIALTIASLILSNQSAKIQAQGTSILLWQGQSKNSSVGESVRNNEVCFDVTVNVPYEGGQVSLSSRADTAAPLQIDDAIRIVVTHADGSKSNTFYQNSSTREIGPFNFSGYLKPGNNAVQVQIIDLIGPLCGGSSIYLVYQDAGSPEQPGCVGGFDATLHEERFPPIIYTSYTYSAPEVAFLFNFLCKGTLITPELSAPNFTFHDLPLSNGSADLTVSPLGEPSSVTLNIDKLDYKTTVGLSDAGGTAEKGVYIGFQRSFKVQNIPSSQDATSSVEGRLVTVTRPRTLKAAKITAVAVSISVTALWAIKLGIQLAPGIIQQLQSLFSEAALLIRNSSPANSHTLISYIPPVKLSSDQVDTTLSQALYATYGPMSSWSALGTLAAHPQKVSPPDHFNFKGDGFTPGGEVLLSFGKPGSSDLDFQVIAADGRGSIHGKYEVTQAPGIYLFSAVDMQTLTNTLTSIGNSGVINRPMTHIEGVLVEIKGDKASEQCDLPSQQHPEAVRIAQEFGVSYEEVPA